jgi:hypothetical protein
MDGYQNFGGGQRLPDEIILEIIHDSRISFVFANSFMKKYRKEIIKYVHVDMHKCACKIYKCLICFDKFDLFCEFTKTHCPFECDICWKESISSRDVICYPFCANVMTYIVKEKGKQLNKQYKYIDFLIDYKCNNNRCKCEHKKYFAQSIVHAINHSDCNTLRKLLYVTDNFPGFEVLIDCPKRMSQFGVLKTILDNESVRKLNTFYWTCYTHIISEVFLRESMQQISLFRTMFESLWTREPQKTDELRSLVQELWKKRIYLRKKQVLRYLVNKHGESAKCITEWFDYLREIGDDATENIEFTNDILRLNKKMDLKMKEYVILFESTQRPIGFLRQIIKKLRNSGKLEFCWGSVFDLAMKYHFADIIQIL